MTARFCDELPFGFGWIAATPGYMQRASHALVDEGRVWLVDPVDVEELDERIRAVGKPVGVIQLLDRHGRDCAALAERYGVPLHRLPFSGVIGSPFDVRRSVDLPRWREAALWWPARRTLIVADALGTASYFLASGRAPRRASAVASRSTALARRTRAGACALRPRRGSAWSRGGRRPRRRALDLAPWHPALAGRLHAPPTKPLVVRGTRYASRPRAIPKSA